MLNLDLLFPILVPDAHHSIHHAQGQVLAIICPSVDSKTKKSEMLKIMEQGYNVSQH